MATLRRGIAGSVLFTVVGGPRQERAAQAAVRARPGRLRCVVECNSAPGRGTSHLDFA